MRQLGGLYIGSNMSVQKFVGRFSDLNRYLLYFLEEHSKQLDQDEIFEILDQAKSPEWHKAMVNAGIDNLDLLLGNLFLISSNLEKSNGPSPTSITVDDKKI
jgi:hypothetical protein